MNKNSEGTNLEVVTTQIVRLGLYRYTKSRSHVWSSDSHQSKRTLRASSLVEKNPNLKSSKIALLIDLVQDSQIPSISHSWFASQVEPSKPKVEPTEPKVVPANDHMSHLGNTLKKVICSQPVLGTYLQVILDAAHQPWWTCMESEWVTSFGLWGILYHLGGLFCDMLSLWNKWVLSITMSKCKSFTKWQATFSE